MVAEGRGKSADIQLQLDMQWAELSRWPLIAVELGFIRVDGKGDS